MGKACFSYSVYPVITDKRDGDNRIRNSRKINMMNRTSNRIIIQDAQV